MPATWQKVKGSDRQGIVSCIPLSFVLDIHGLFLKGEADLSVEGLYLTKIVR